MALINRYPICAYFYYRVAKRLGYSENEAKSLGLGRATFFAAAKRGFGFTGGRRKKSKGGRKGPFTKLPQLNKKQELDSIVFAGLETTIVYTDDGIRAVMGDQVMRPDRFDSYVLTKIDHFLGAERWAIMDEIIDAELDKYDNQTLNTQMAYKIYQAIRDVLREEQTYQKEVVDVHN